MKYGPNTRAVERLIERIRDLTPEQEKRLGNATRDAAWEAAWDAAWDAMFRPAGIPAWQETWNAARGAVRASVLVAAWDAITDALLATMVWDQISEDQYETLMGPWRSMMD